MRTNPERAILVRVIDRGRVGSHRTGNGDKGDLAAAIRQATAQSRARDPLAGLHHLPADDSPLDGPIDGLYDEEIGRMGSGRAKSLLDSLPAKQETLYMSWSEGRIAVFNSRGIRRTARVSALGFEVRTGRRPGSGRAGDAARRLAAMDLEGLIAMARDRRGDGNPGELPAGPTPAVLSPATVIELLDLLNHTSFSAKAYYDGTSFLREHINIQVFDRRFHLLDDGTESAGLPFPFDLEGTAKGPIDLIAKGTPKTPTLDQRQAAVLGLPPTAHAIGGDNAQAENLFLETGEETEAELVEKTGDGIWVGWLENLECYEPKRVLFRARARGVRAIRNGRLGKPLPDFIWEDSMLRTFSSLPGLASGAASRLSADGCLGGVTAPAVAVTAIEANGRS
ncbi:MAG: metallopeptidase TldD-related protein [Acidobacteriota bacterium]|nr:metallopeptidase TldD-related protein [Acidobacteriota bacterium]